MFDWLKRKRAPHEAYLNRRQRWFDARREDVTGSDREFPTAWGILFEWSESNIKATLFAHQDGVAFVEFSDGRGIVLGGVGSNFYTPPTVFEAIYRLLEQAQDPAESAFLGADSPLPERGQVQFVFLCDGGPRGTAASERELKGGRHNLSPLYFAAQALIDQLRIRGRTVRPLNHWEQRFVNQRSAERRRSS